MNGLPAPPALWLPSKAWVLATLVPHHLLLLCGMKQPAGTDHTMLASTLYPTCATDQENYTPLYKAVGGSCEAIVKILLERGADVSIANDMGQMPIHYAR